MSQTVRGYLRGLEILKVLSEERYATAAAIAKATDLPRPTVHRMLVTLVSAGYAVQASGGKYFSLSSKVSSLSEGYDDVAQVIEKAEPYMKDLSNRINWSTYLHTLEGGAMVTRAIGASPRELGNPKLGTRLPLAHFSPGRAYLATLSTEEFEAISAKVCKEKFRQQSVPMSQDFLRAIIKQVRRIGIGFREGGAVPRTCSFAIPIQKNGQAVAYLTTNFISSTRSLPSAIDKHYTNIADTVAHIEREIGGVGNCYGSTNVKPAMTAGGILVH